MYKCSCCGEIFDEIPLCFGTDFPFFYNSIPDNEIEQRVQLAKSLCIIDEKYFFHRGRLIIPINDYSEDLIFNVWTTISEDNFAVREELWNDPKRKNQEPYFGWLQTAIPTYGETINIKTIAIEQEVGLIPEIMVIEGDHQLTIDQENGISYKKAIEIVDSLIRVLHNP